MGNFYIEVYDEWTPEILDIFGTFKTREEAEQLIEKLYGIDYFDIIYPLEDISVNIHEMAEITDVDTEFEKAKEAVEQRKAENKRERAENVEKAKKAILLLERAKEVLKPFNLDTEFTKENFQKRVAEMHKAIVNAGIKVRLFDRTNDYYSNGEIEKWDRRERWLYEPIVIYPEDGDAGYCDLFRYNYGNWDIDNDIANLRNYISENEEKGE